MSDFSLCVWCFINIKGIIHPRIKIGECFIFIPSFTHSKFVLNLSFLLLLNINAILKKVENQTVSGPQWLPYYFFPCCQSQCGPATVWFSTFFKISSYWCECMWRCTVYWYSGTRTAADRMCAVARYNDISSKADRGDIFIRAAAGQMGALSRILLLCPLPQILWNKKNTYHNRTLIKYKSK